MVMAMTGAIACGKTHRIDASPVAVAGSGQGGDGGNGGGGHVNAGGLASSGAGSAGSTGSGGPPTNLGTAQDVTALWAGGATYVCWLNGNGELLCTSGSPADEFIRSACLLDGCGPKDAGGRIDLGTGAQVEQIVVALHHACALLGGGRVKCWGAGGVLGLGDDRERRRPSDLGDALPFLDFGTEQPVVELAAGGGNHTCARFEDGSVRCWGGNSAGQLGLGDSEARGDDPLEMGSALPAVDLGAGQKAVALAAAGSSTCALLESGQTKCWGANLFGELGLGDLAPRGAQAGEMGDALPAIELGSRRTAVALAAGSSHFCAMLDDGSSKCWGMGGVLGLGDNESRGDEPGEMGDALPALDLGTDWRVARIVGGGGHNCAVSGAMGLKCWGQNGGDRLGVGDKEARGDDAGEMGDALPEVPLGDRRLVSVALGDTFTCALLDDNSLACWGNWHVIPNVP